MLEKTLCLQVAPLSSTLCQHGRFSSACTELSIAGSYTGSMS